MFVQVQDITRIIDINIGYYTDAKRDNLGDDEYYEKMESKLRHQFNHLQYVSCNKTLIAKYEKKLKNIGII